MLLTSSDYQNLERSYISRQIADDAGLYRVDSLEGRDLVGRRGSGDFSGIVFPYRRDKGTVSNRLRLDNPPIDVETGKPEHKYLAAPGERNHLYFPPCDPALLQNAGVPLVITEGEKKCLALFRMALEVGNGHGTPAFLPVAVAGVWNWRGVVGKRENENGVRVDEKGPVPDLSMILVALRPTIILYDSNVTSNPSVQAAARELSRYLSGRGAQVRMATIPAESGVNGCDDYLAAHGAAALELILLGARPVEQKETPILPARIWVGELLDLKVLTPEMLIEDVLPRRGAVVLTAAQKTGKTILSAQVAIAVASGQALFGFYSLTQGTVLILEADDPAGDASFQDIYNKAKIPRETPIAFYGKTNLRLSGAFYEWLEREITSTSAVLAILDSYTALRPPRKGGGDIVQSEYDEFAALDTMGKRLNCLILVIHHESTTTKANPTLDWDSRGAGTYGITAATEAQMSLVRFRDLAINANERLLRIKGRHQKTIEMVLSFEEKTCSYRHIFEGAASPFYAMLRDIHRFKGGQSFSPKDLKQEIGASDATVYRHLAVLRETGKLVRDGYGEYRISAECARELCGGK